MEDGGVGAGQAERTGVFHTALALEELPSIWQVSTRPPIRMPEGAESDPVLLGKLGDVTSQVTLHRLSQRMPVVLKGVVVPRGTLGEQAEPSQRSAEKGGGNGQGGWNTRLSTVQVGPGAGIPQLNNLPFGKGL